MADPEKLEVLYENADLLVVNKPACIHSTALGRSGGPSLAGLLMKKDPCFSSASPRPGEGGLVNRLDYETSGLLIAARNRTVWERLHAQILSGELKKTYLAILEGEAPEHIRISTFIGSAYRRSRKVRVYPRKPSGRIRALPACSEITRLALLEDPVMSFVRISAGTARRHQIRAHSAFIGHPLAGDVLYGAQPQNPEMADREGLPAFFLHAYELSFHDRLTQKEISIAAPLPAYFPERTLIWKRET